MLLGTAGHVDHGKTTLVHALTGVQCDRLDAERTRGITIELGFAPWDLPDGRRIDVVDVPGHERLVRTMLVGAGGMDAVLLAVAADAGVMPQTREHLAACAALGINRGIVALTRSDLVDDIDAVMVRVRQQLGGTVLANAPLIPVCAPTGAGLAELTAAATALMNAWVPPPEDAPIYLPVDRVFTIEGAGTVVTGTLVRGTLRVGETVAVVPGLERARIRGLQNHGNALTIARAGRRVAVNLAVPRAAIKRGAVLAEPGTLVEGQMLDVTVHAAQHLTRSVHRMRGVTLHLGASRVLGDLRTDAPIEPGTQGTGRLRLKRPIPIPPGARFVLRGAADHTHGAVIGGGRVIDARPPRKRRSVWRTQLAQTQDPVSILVKEAGRFGFDPAELAARLPVRTQTGARRFAPEVVASAAAELAQQIDAFHTTQPEMIGLPAAQLRTPLMQAALAHLGEAVEHVQGVLKRPGHRATLSPDHAVMARKLLRAIGRTGLDGLDLAALDTRFVHASRANLERVLGYLVRVERLARVGTTWVAAREAFALRQTTAAAVLEAPLSVADFKTLTGTTRRRAIPFLEWLDSEGITRREDNMRVAGTRAADFS